MFEFLFEIVFELFSELFLEILWSVFSHSLLTPFATHDKDNRIGSFISYAIVGIISGFISIYIFPSSFIKNETIQLINLIPSPIILGILFSWYGRIREKKGLETIALDKFSYGYIFALSMGIVRYFFTS